MRVSGFTFCRNTVKYDYSLEEAIRSILPRVDEFVVNVGNCDDGTLELVERIGDPKIRPRCWGSCSGSSTSRETTGRSTRRARSGRSASSATTGASVPTAMRSGSSAWRTAWT